MVFVSHLKKNCYVCQSPMASNVPNNIVTVYVNGGISKMFCERVLN